MHRALVPLLAGTAVIVLLAVPADAHGRTGHAGPWHSEIVAVAPIDGVRWGIHGNDEQLWVVNESGRDLVVLGYDEEPYLRVGPEGVFVNRRSPATYRNRSRSDAGALPDVVDPAADPDWRRVSGGTAHAWFDHRIHWDEPELPRPVAAAPARQQVVAEWVVPFRFGGGRLPVFGELSWIPQPAGWPWLALGAAAGALALAGLRRRDRRRALAPAVAVVIGVAVLDLLHLVPQITAVPPGGDIDLGAAGAAVGLSVAAAALALGGRTADRTGCALVQLGAIALFVGHGLLVRPLLTAPNLPGAPDWALKLAVGASLAQLPFVVLSAELVRRRDGPSNAEAET